MSVSFDTFGSLVQIVGFAFCFFFFFFFFFVSEEGFTKDQDCILRGADVEDSTKMACTRAHV